MTNSNISTDGAGMQTKLGPYERWMAEFGKDYDLPSLLLSNPTFLSCLAQFADPQQNTDHLKQLADYGIDAGSLGPWIPEWTPTIWRGPEGNEFKYRFLPLLMKTPGTSSDAPQETFEKALFTTATFGAELNGLAKAFEEHETARFSSLEHEDVSQLPDDIRNLLNSLKDSDADGQKPPQFKVGFPLHAQSVIVNSDNVTQPVDPQPDENYDPEKPLVIIAVIDDGIPFAHTAFRCKKSQRTRVDYYWNQSAEQEGSVVFGREISSSEIDDMVDYFRGEEDVIYRKAGVLGGDELPISSLAGHASHGAHVAGLAAGEWPDDSEANVRIIAVDLPASSSWDTSGYGKDMFVLSAIHYIFDRADKIANAYNASSVPLVINLSYGYSGGPKDGTGLIEQAMGEMIQHRRSAMNAATALVMPSGNMFLDRLHAVVTEEHVSGAKTATLPWSIAQNDRTSSFMEIWLPSRVVPDDFRFVVKTPEGHTALDTQEIDHTYFFTNLHVGEERIGQFSIDRPGLTEVERPDGSKSLQSRIMIALAPTETVGELPAAPAGRWQIEISYAHGRTKGRLTGYTVVGLKQRLPADIRCWIQRDVSFGYGNTGAKQSFFDDPLNSLYDDQGRPYSIDSVWKDGFLVRRFGSINGMSTHHTVIVVGGYVESRHSVAPYSSAGSLRKNFDTEWARMAGDQVNCAAPCERSTTEFGITSIGTRSGSFFAMNGTSVAAPQVSRKLGMSFIEDPKTWAGWDKTDGNPVLYTSAYVRRLKPETESYVVEHGTIKEKDRALIGSGLV